MSEHDHRKYLECQLQQLHQEVINLEINVDHVKHISDLALNFKDDIRSEKNCAEDQQINEKQITIILMILVLSINILKKERVQIRANRMQGK